MKGIGSQRRGRLRWVTTTRPGSVLVCMISGVQFDLYGLGDENFWRVVVGLAIRFGVCRRADGDTVVCLGARDVQSAGGDCRQPDRDRPRPTSSLSPVCVTTILNRCCRWCWRCILFAGSKRGSWFYLSCAGVIAALGFLYLTPPLNNGEASWSAFLLSGRPSSKAISVSMLYSHIALIIDVAIVVTVSMEWKFR